MVPASGSERFAIQPAVMHKLRRPIGDSEQESFGSPHDPDDSSRSARDKVEFLNHPKAVSSLLMRGEGKPR